MSERREQVAAGLVDDIQGALALGLEIMNGVDQGHAFLMPIRSRSSSSGVILSARGGWFSSRPFVHSDTWSSNFTW